MYEIGDKTIIIKKVLKEKYRSKIIEENKVEFSIHSPAKIIDYNCIKNGASFKGRIETVMNILGSKSKLPVPILPKKGIYMFPTSSMKNADCMFLSYYHIEKYSPYGKFANIQFKDKSHILVKTSFNQLDLQMKRTSQVIAYYTKLLYL